jgi:PPP family 3-phenylpropionic acid transporter
VAGLAAALAGPVWTHFADTRLGSTRALRLSAFATAIAALAFMATGSTIGPIILMASLLWACSAPGMPLTDTLAVTVLGPGRMTAYGSIRLWMSLGWAVAVIGFGALYERAGLGPVMPVYALGMLALGLTTYGLRSLGAAEPARAHSRLGAVGDAVRAAPRLLPFIAGAFLISTAWSAAFAFLGLRIVGQGGGPFLVGLAAGLTAFVEIPVMRATDPLARRFGLRAVYMAGAVVYVVLFACWAVVSDPTAIALVASVEGVAFALVYVSQVVLVGRLVPKPVLASGQGLFSGIVRSAAPIVGSLAGGIVFGRLGAPVLFAGCAGLVALGATVVWLVLAGVDAAAGPPHVAPPPTST